MMQFLAVLAPLPVPLPPVTRYDYAVACRMVGKSGDFEIVGTIRDDPTLHRNFRFTSSNADVPSIDFQGSGGSPQYEAVIAARRGDEVFEGKLQLPSGSPNGFLAVKRRQFDRKVSKFNDEWIATGLCSFENRLKP